MRWFSERYFTYYRSKSTLVMSFSDDIYKFYHSHVVVNTRRSFCVKQAYNATELMTRSISIFLEWTIFFSLNQNDSGTYVHM
jgi:hypothetical protein